MGISSSSNRRRNNNYHLQNVPSQLISSSPYPSVDPSYSSPPDIYSPPPPPALPVPTPSVYNPYADGSNYSNSGLIVRPNFGPYRHPHANYNYGWVPPMRPPQMVPAPPPLPPPMYVEHQQAKKVKNHVNLHKDTLKVEVDEENPDCHLVSFMFDASFDGSITIYYFAKEEPDCHFVPIYPEYLRLSKSLSKKELVKDFSSHQEPGLTWDSLTLTLFQNHHQGKMCILL